jgi:hypothetical protein
LKLPDLSALPVNLVAHALDFAPNEFDVWHAQPLRKPIRTKQEQECKASVSGGDLNSTFAAISVHFIGGGRACVFCMELRHAPFAFNRTQG